MKQYNVVILHGWMQKKEDWESLNSQFKALKQIHKIHLLDLPGFGKQKLISNTWGIPEYSDWVKNQITETRSQNVILFGHSFGGRIAAHIASSNPSWLKALILSGAPVIYRPNTKTKVVVNLFKRLKKFVPKSIKNSFYNEELRQARSNGLENVFKKAVVFDQTNNLKKISVPTLLIWGQEDKSVPLSIAKESLKLIKNSQLKIVRNAGHNAYHKSPYLFFSYVKNFVENL